MVISGFRSGEHCLNLPFQKRCVDSGLWKPATDDPETNPEDGFKKKTDGGDEDNDKDGDQEEPTYEDPSAAAAQK